jgi:hypothetical protein
MSEISLDEKEGTRAPDSKKHTHMHTHQEIKILLNEMMRIIYVYNGC